MENNLLNEINYLTRLIEQHKRKAPEKVPTNIQNQSLSLTKLKRLNTFSKSRVTSESLCKVTNKLYIKPELKTAKVHVNTNFKPQNPMVYINPRINNQLCIHINPKLVKDITSQNENVENDANNTVWHVEQNVEQNVVQTNTKRSVYVNPKLMKKLSSTTECKISDKKSATPENNQPTCSRLKFVRNVANTKTTPKRNNNSSVIILSRRKLVRVKRSPKALSGMSTITAYKIKRLSHSPFKKVKSNSPKVTKGTTANEVLQAVNKNCQPSKSQGLKPKINKYRIDRTVPQTMKVKKGGISETKKSLNNTMELITIGGIVYKSSRNQLVRRSYSLKKKRMTNVKNDKFIITTNGKKLRRLKTAKETSNQGNNNTPNISVANGLKNTFNISFKVNHKNNISNKMKQKSIHILRNKMRKNNQPCLLFQRFGYCANQENGKCPKLHDKKQVSVCKKFLQGKCLLDKCPLSHNVGPEKMPTCKYFLEGCCTRDACPYLHVKMSSNTPICIDFLQGYCAKGNECNRRHEYLCPEFEKSGNCSKGKYCPYPHKSCLPTLKQNDKYLQRKQDESKSQSKPPIVDDNASSNQENRLRYYERSDNLNEDLDKKRENIMKKIKIMKGVEAALRSNESNIIDTLSPEIIEMNPSQKKDTENKLLKRPPIGSLPAYIPIN